MDRQYYHTLLDRAMDATKEGDSFMPIFQQLVNNVPPEKAKGFTKDMSREDFITLNGIADNVHMLAWNMGWHSEDEGEDSFIERTCNNLHDEISELHEAWRSNKLHKLCDKSEKMKSVGIVPLTSLEEELADILIRVLDSAAKLDIDIQDAVERKHKFNATREYRHGNKRS